MGQETSKKYEINDFRKRNLLRLKKYMNEVLFDQIPPLHDLFRALEELNLSNTNSTLTNNPFIVEMVAEISRSLEKLNVKEIAQRHLNIYFKSADLKKEYEILSDAYNLDNVEYFMEDPSCAACGKEATKRCSKCKSEWYCSKECQIKRWKNHKEMCKKLTEINESEESNKTKNSQKLINTKTSGPVDNITETKLNKVKIEEINDKKEEEKESKLKEKIFDELD